jgi:hypothetical protein
VTDEPTEDPIDPGLAIYQEPAHEAFACPRCSRLFEKPFMLPSGQMSVGHVQGGPDCKPVNPASLLRDARTRRLVRRAR